MGMRVSLAFFFFFSVLAQGKARKNPKNFGQVPGRTDRNCGGSTALFFLFFFGVGSEPGTGASLQKMWRGDRTFLFFLRSEPGTGAS